MTETENKPQTAAPSQVRIERHPDRAGCWLLQTEQWFPQEVRSVFGFFADAGNLEAITPPWLRFRIVTPVPIEMQPGVLIDYRLRLHGIPFNWRTKITAWEPTHRFVDEQIRGPYRCWIHEHFFEPAEGGTLVRDRVTYSVPGGVLIQKLLVGRDLSAIFSFRQQKLQEVMGSRA